MVKLLLNKNHQKPIKINNKLVQLQHLNQLYKKVNQLKEEIQVHKQRYNNRILVHSNQEQMLQVQQEWMLINKTKHYNLQLHRHKELQLQIKTPLQELINRNQNEGVRCNLIKINFLNVNEKYNVFLIVINKLITDSNLLFS